MSTRTQSALSPALAFLGRLEAAGVAYRLDVRDALMVSLAIPGERQEVEFLSTTIPSKSRSSGVRATWRGRTP